MRNCFVATVVLATFSLSGLSASPTNTRVEPQDKLTYPNMCDASAAVAINSKLFVVANDEDNVLRIFRRDEATSPKAFSFPEFLKTGQEDSEIDIEGATRIGDVVFWIGSHAQNRNGKDRPNRHRLFATRITMNGDTAVITPEGAIYTNLRSDLIREPSLSNYNFTEAAKRAPEQADAFNIEGLAATPDGKLLIGFRNPIPNGKSLVIPIENPFQILAGQKAKLGTPRELDLGGLGIRSIEYSETRRKFLILAGPFNDSGQFALFAWPGDDTVPSRIPEVNFTHVNPEAMFIYPGEQSAVQFLSDDGGVKVDGQDCKDAPIHKREFKSFRMNVP